LLLGVLRGAQHRLRHIQTQAARLERALHGFGLCLQQVTVLRQPLLLLFGQLHFQKEQASLGDGLPFLPEQVQLDLTALCRSPGDDGIMLYQAAELLAQAKTKGRAGARRSIDRLVQR